MISAGYGTGDENAITEGVNEILKKTFVSVMLAAAVVGMTITSYADIISDAPSAVSGGSQEVQKVSPGSNEMVSVSIGNGETVIVDVPGSLPDLPAAGSIGSGSSRSTSITAPIQPTEPQDTVAPGAKYADAAKTAVDLGFTVVSPNCSYNGFMVAEGMVQLANGSWETIGHDQYIRQPYYRLLREDGDWYVVAVNAKRIGNYATSDGSRVTELWLRKSECTASSSIELNTTNAKRQQIVKYALSLLGKGYQYGGNGPDVFDCSGFVNSVMSNAGIKVARTSSEICNAGSSVGLSGLRPGDIVGRPGHVGIYIGNGYFIHAAESSSGVITDSVEIYNRSAAFTAYRNVVGD